jgi:hypothetical protein
MVGSIWCISMPVDGYISLVNRCFNETYDRKPLVLGQRDPVGLSIENLISLIEKVERKKPELSAPQIIVLIMRRYEKYSTDFRKKSQNQKNLEFFISSDS